MGSFKEKLFGLVDNGAATAMCLFDTMNKTIDSIDWDKQFESLNTMKDSLVKKGEELMSDFNELMKQVKDTISDFKLTVPYNEEIGEKFECTVNDGKLFVKVTYNDEFSSRSSENSIKIPQNCDVEKMTKKYDKEKKTMTISIPKIIAEPNESKEEDDNGKTDAHEAASKLLRRFRQARMANTPSQSESESTEAGNPLPRGANGRFVKRKVNKAN